MASLVKLNAQLHLAQLAFSKNPSDINQAKIDELLAQISEVSVIADDSKQSKTGQTESPEVKKNEGKAPAKPQAPKAPAPAKPKEPAKPKTPAKPKAPAKEQPAETPPAPAANQEELTNSSQSSEESTEKLPSEATDSQTLQETNEQIS